MKVKKMGISTAEIGGFSSHTGGYSTPQQSQLSHGAPLEQGTG
jgi:hypothetical protein